MLRLYDRHAPRKPRPLGQDLGELYKMSWDPYPGAKHCRKAEPPPSGRGGFTIDISMLDSKINCSHPVNTYKNVE